MANVEAELALAREALGRGDAAAGLEALLEAWRRLRLPAIATAIDALSKKIDATLPPVDPALSGKAYHQAWMEVARGNRAIDVERLLPGLLREPLGDALIERTRHIAGRPEDPRVAGGFVAMVTQPPATSQSIIGKLWAPVFGTLEALQDVRWRAALAKRAKDPGEKSKFWPQHLRKVSSLVDKLRDAPIASADIQRSVETIASLVSKMSVDSKSLAGPKASTPKASKARGAKAHAKAPALAQALTADPISMVLADPTSIDARLVAADALILAGDPRGELIQLQHAIATGKGNAKIEKRVRELLKLHLDRWVPAELRSVLSPKQFDFRLGFLGSCEVAFSSEPERNALLDHPAWGTVTELFTDDVELMTRPQLRSLDRVGSFDTQTLRELAATGRALPITRIGAVYLRTLPPRDLGNLRAMPLDAFPRVRELELYYTWELADERTDVPEGCKRWRWLPEVPLVRQVATLRIVDATLDDPAWMQAFTELEKLEKLVLVKSMVWELARNGDTLSVTAGIKDAALDKRGGVIDYYERDLKAAIVTLEKMGVARLELVDLLESPNKKGLAELAARLHKKDFAVVHRPGSFPGERVYAVRDREIPRTKRFAAAKAKRAR